MWIHRLKKCEDSACITVETSDNDYSDETDCLKSNQKDNLAWWKFDIDCMASGNGWGIRFIEENKEEESTSRQLCLTVN